MNIIKAYIYPFLTMPGVVFNQLLGILIRKAFRLSIFEVQFFKFENPPSFINAEKPPLPIQQTIISIVPFYISSLLGFLFALTGLMPILVLKDTSSIINYLSILIGFGLCAHSLPSNDDAKFSWDASLNSTYRVSYRVLLIASSGIVYGLTCLSSYGIRLLYPILLTIVLPLLMSR